MYYNIRRDCKVLRVEPFAIMAGHGTGYGLDSYDVSNILHMSVGLNPARAVGQRETIIPQGYDVVVVHNFTHSEIVKIDTAGMRSVVKPDDILSFGNYVSGKRSALEDRTKDKLQEVCNYNQVPINNKIVIFKMVSITADTEEGLGIHVTNSNLSASVKETILTCRSKKVIKSCKSVFAFEFMLVFVIDPKEFNTDHTILESQTQVCLSSLPMDASFCHPLDTSLNVVNMHDTDSLSSMHQPLRCNMELVYHRGTFEPRYVNNFGKVSEIPQVWDTTRLEGFHYTVFTKNPKSPHISTFRRCLKLEDLTEANGFYMSHELAATRKTDKQATEIIETLQTLSGSVKSLRNEIIKDLSGFTKASLDKLILITEKSLSESRLYAEKKHAEYNVHLDETSKTIEKLQEELRDNKRTHETAMQSRKEVLETIRLIPPLLGCIAAIMAFKKKK